MTLKAVPRSDLIRRAARRHFLLHGYDGASMRDIAADAGITIATLYFHCGTKEQLLFDVLEERTQELLSGSQAAVAQAQGDTWAPRLRAAIQFLVDFVTRGDEGAAISTSELRGLTGELRERHLATRDAYEHHLRDLLQCGIAAREFEPVDVPVIVAGIIGMGLAVGRWYRPHGRLTAAQVAEEYVAFTLRGLGVSGASAAGRASPGNGTTAR